MDRHPFFDIILHTNEELESRLSSRGTPYCIVERVTLHEWPLSCVQRLTLEDGRRVIYKSQSGPTVEAQFYARARSRLLVQAETVYQDGPYTCMLFEYLDAPRLCDLKMPEQEAFQIGQQLLAEIRRIDGNLPVYLDVSTWESWQAEMGAMLEKLHDLVSRGVFRLVTKELTERVRQIASSAVVRPVIDGPSGLVHGDLGGDNIFLLPDGYRVIDWQRPIRGPVGLDLTSLVESFGYEPLRWTGRGLVLVMTLLHIHWLTACASRWFQAGSATYDCQIADLAHRIGMII